MYKRVYFSSSCTIKGKATFSTTSLYYCFLYFVSIWLTFLVIYQTIQGLKVDMSNSLDMVFFFHVLIAINIYIGKKKKINVYTRKAQNYWLSKTSCIWIHFQFPFSHFSLLKSCVILKKKLQEVNCKSKIKGLDHLFGDGQHVQNLRQ